VKPAGESEQGLLSDWWQERKQRAMQSLVHSSAPVLKKTLGDLGAVIIENATVDPDMFECVRPIIRTIVTNLWEDVEMEIESGLKLAVYQKPEGQGMTQSNQFRHDPELARGRLRRLGLKIRAFVLHHYLPFNRSIFGRLRDPVYLLMTFTTMLPIFGIRVFFFMGILVMLLFPGPPDEFQLINFILIFKGTQFFTTGVILGFLGAMEYYACYLFGGTSLRDCIDSHGPGASDYLSSLLFDYAGSMCLVWIAFLFLPMSRAAWHTQQCLQGKRREIVTEVYCCCLRGAVGRGGKMRGLLRYDFWCFVFSFVVFLPVYFASDNHVMSEAAYDTKLAHAKQTIFWCRILYSLLSLPFVVFVIPGVGKVLTHSATTGYDRSGACVEFAFDEVGPQHRKAG